MKRGGPLKRTKGLSQGKGLERRAPLARGGSSLSPGDGLKRTKGLAPISKRQREKKPSAERAAAIERMREDWIKLAWLEFRDERGRLRCAVCDRTSDQLTITDHRGQKFHGHHVVPQQRLVNVARERGIPVEYLHWDPRGGLLLCVSCHMDHEHGVRRIPHRALTYSNLCFASDVGEEVYLERTYPLRPDRRDRPGAQRG